MASLLQALNAELARLRTWIESYPEPIEQRSPEWERNYGGWADLWRAFSLFVSVVPCQAWSEETAENILYAIARDTDRQGLVREVAKNPDNLLCLAERAVRSQQPDAKWQIASELSHLGLHSPLVETLLLLFARDDDEYVRRRALLALADIESAHVTDLVHDIWNSAGESVEYSRMAVLYALWKIGSPQLDTYLALAETDERQSLVDYAARVRAGNAD